MVDFDENDVRYMRRALQLARLGRYAVSPNPMVGAVIVADNRIIGEGYHRRFGGKHAEVNAIDAADDNGNGARINSATLYVTLEPCAHFGKTPPCADLIINRGVRRVVVACTDPFPSVDGKGIERMRNAGIRVDVGCMEAEARSLNEKFFTAHSLKRPFIMLKWAQSSDGFIDRNRPIADTPTLFSTPLTSVMTHRLRAEYDAVLVGSQTVIADRPGLTVRKWAGRNPVRVVVDRRHRLTGKESVFSDDAPTLCYDSPLIDILSDLYARHNITSLLVEGGATVLQSFIDEGLFDNIRVETSPTLIADGVKAPVLPTNVTEIHEFISDGNKIVIIKKLN